jgi:hypothetical protein
VKNSVFNFTLYSDINEVLFWPMPKVLTASTLEVDSDTNVYNVEFLITFLLLIVLVGREKMNGI